MLVLIHLLGLLSLWVSIHHLLCCAAKLQVHEEKDDAHEETDAAHHYEGDPQGRVLPAKDARGGDDHALGPLKRRHLKVVANFQPVGEVCPQALTLTEGSGIFLV